MANIIISHPELKPYVHYDSKCCGLVPYLDLWGNPRLLMCCYSNDDEWGKLVYDYCKFTY